MSELLEIIGVAGTNGSGKDTVGQLLSDHWGYLFISVTDMLRDELKRRNEPVDRTHLRALSSEWRDSQGLGVLVDKALNIYREKGVHRTGLVISSLRNPGEADRVHELGGKVLWVDADPQLRYERIQKNAASRNRAGEDSKTYEQFLDDEKKEMNRAPGASETTLDMSAVKDKSDILLINNYKDQTALEVAVKRAFGL